MAYSLSTKFIAELLSMTVYIAIGNGCTANEVLPRTKGNSMGMGFVAIAYGLAFFIATAMFGHISTVPNPAFVFAQPTGPGAVARRQCSTASVTEPFATVPVKSYGSAALPPPLPPPPLLPHGEDSALQE
ncbi:hypothetical protein JKP88DRAFT_274507 [Tribonema minus]|uniref:Aquaporin n=1 Tax=Tribonema minus TaxID=303371 RepID=A0A836C7L0_9STRA|nr:hypothetical protein JKP88DRAFT_274507 [Tribonema minus]